MFILNEEQEKRVKEIYEKCYVIDSQAYLADSFPILPEMTQEVNGLIKVGNPILEIRAQDIRMKFSKILSDPQYKKAVIEGIKKSGVNAWCTTMGMFGLPRSSYEVAIKDLAFFYRLCSEFNFLKLVTKAEDIRQAKKEDRVGIILNIQNTACLFNDWVNLEVCDKLINLKLFYDLGIRIITLAYNTMNSVAGGCIERSDVGLSYLGVEIVEKMNELGMLIDTSHCSHQTTMDVLEVSKDPIAMTHTSCKSVYNHSRAKTDEEIKAVAEKGGYIGILILPGFIAEGNVSIDSLLEHIDHAINVGGIDHVGVGTDFVGMNRIPALAKASNKDVLKSGFRPEDHHDLLQPVEGYENWQDWPNITRGLVSRGYSDDAIEKIIGGNFLRVFEEVVG